MELIDFLNETCDLRRKSLAFKLMQTNYRPLPNAYDACVPLLLPDEKIKTAVYMPVNVCPAGRIAYPYSAGSGQRGILVVSNCRILFSKYYDGNHSFYEISADDITDVYYDTDPKEAYLRVNGRNVVFVVHDELLVVERLKKAVDELRYAQPEPEAAAPIQTNPAENMDQITEAIKNLKSLLDLGAITQEEFDAKKKQLLGLN
ncbi:SHOCT domain-containing protein [Gemmiger sp. An194]|uniref:SHOCT domain-containing protein n=1 Tax=Gemmiger sp. An194 TaxID=1965582 RepID=UPI000B5818E4|nr:SHOCT domain-containing protein [Gemmiger sp. An194]OUP24012.1 hypothetical protein B5F28_09075 [Gemmiger sp. An194]